MNTGKLILGLLAGFATGTMLGMLFSPKKQNEKEKEKEKEVRERRSRRGEPRELAEFNKKFDRLMNGVRHDFDRIKKEVAEVPRQSNHHHQRGRI
jgi:gas vesicle protein